MIGAVVVWGTGVTVGTGVWVGVGSGVGAGVGLADDAVIGVGVGIDVGVGSGVGAGVGLADDTDTAVGVGTDTGNCTETGVGTEVVTELTIENDSDKNTPSEEDISSLYAPDSHSLTSNKMKLFTDAPGPTLFPTRGEPNDNPISCEFGIDKSEVVEKVEFDPEMFVTSRSTRTLLCSLPESLMGLKHPDAIGEMFQSTPD